MDGAGDLYGTTYCDGAYGQGSVFKLTHINGAWTSATLYSFTWRLDGGYPMSNVVIDANGNLYGTTAYGGPYGGFTGCGLGDHAVAKGKNPMCPENLQHAFAKLASILLFALAMVTMPSAHAQTYHILHSFTGAGDGGYPQAGVTIDRAGNLYGTTASGGPYQYNGTVYELKPRDGNWTLDTLYDFGSGGRDDGAAPYAGVVFGPDGTLYGTTSGGGNSGDGTVFKLSPPARACQNVSCSWTETILHSFMGGGDGATPYYGSLTFDPAGNIYGATSAGGANNLGPCHRGGCGTVFELTPSNGGWNETIIHAFGGTDGDFPLSGVILDQAGNVYGTTSLGGQNLCDNTPCGTVYELSNSAGSGWAESFLLSASAQRRERLPMAG